MLSARGISLRPGGKNIDLDLGPGKALAVLGPSGSGKSRLLRRLADLDPGPGDIAFEGKPASSQPAPAWRQKVMFVPAEPGFWEESANEISGLAPALAADLGLDGLAEVALRQLSTGQRVRLALLRALAARPRVLLLDEPTGPLDPASTERVESVLRGQMKAGLSVLLSTHDDQQPARLGADILRLGGA